MKTVILNPSWQACGRMLLEVVEHGDTQQARDDAKAEILKGLGGYDAMLAKHTDYFEEKEVCAHVYADDGDPRCINCNAPAVTS
jgi:hypothetical protein